MDIVTEDYIGVMLRKNRPSYHTWGKTYDSQVQAIINHSRYGAEGYEFYIVEVVR